MFCNNKIYFNLFRIYIIIYIYNKNIKKKKIEKLNYKLLNF